MYVVIVAYYTYFARSLYISWCYLMCDLEYTNNYELHSGDTDYVTMPESRHNECTEVQNPRRMRRRKRMRLSVEADSRSSCTRTVALQQRSFRGNPTKFHPFIVC